MSRLKVVTIVGTRPEVIRLSSLLPALDEYTDHILVHTGQNYDRQLNEVFFEELNLRLPDHVLKVDTSSFGTVMADTIRGTERVLTEVRPDAVLILGDTNSAISAVVAERMKIPVYHMEAGNRSFDRNVPEELNRKLVDHIASFNLVYSEHARRNLIREGLEERFVFLTGSPLPEVLEANSNAIEQSKVLENLGVSRGGYILLSLHRQENVDSIENLSTMLSSIDSAAKALGVSVVFSLHPRTQSKITPEMISDRFLIHSPFGFFDYMKLQKNAYCVISDSGSVSEESLIMGFPAVTLRNSMERPEALESGGIVLAPTGTQSLETAILLARRSKPSQASEVYSTVGFSSAVLNILQSTARVSEIWLGRRN
jgi:UDP-N-acetylglucosamine 2-epimerase (non-hydrolysing)